MKNPFKKLIKLILDFLRKRQLKKRDLVCDDVINKLTPKVAEIQKNQKDLMDRIIKDFPKDVGIYNGSKFIPYSGKNEAECWHTLMNKYGDDLEKNRIELTLDLRFKCI